MSRADRRHHEERVKDRWRRRIRRTHDVSRLDRYTSPPPEPVVEAQAVRRAHHNRCPCSICKGPRYQRARAGRGGR